MLINTVYVDGGSAVISVVTGLHDCDGRICVPFLECDESDMEVIDIENEIARDEIKSKLSVSWLKNNNVNN